MLGVEVVEEAPFAPIGEKTLSMNRGLIQKANYIIITPIPFGKGNLANLQLSAEACQAGKPVLIMANDFAKRDFTGGTAGTLVDKMRESGAVFIDTPKELFKFLENGL